MGRKIRKVPAGWEHPRDERGHFRALHDKDYDTACEEWWAAAVRWHANGEDGDPDGWEDYERGARKDPDHRWYWDWNGPSPVRESYRPAFDAPADHFQVYETVSEGTPCSPVFASLDDLVEWMVQPIDRRSEYNRGADWQCMQGKTRQEAEAFTKSQWAPSGAFTSAGFVDGVAFIAQESAP